jgi:hypothetical protein
MSLVLSIAVAACGGPKKPSSVPVLPDEAKAEPAPPDKPADKPVEKTPPPPPAPTGPIEVTVPAPQMTVKLVSPGKGKRVALKFTPKVGSKQQVELALDFAEQQKAPAELGGDSVNALPTVVLVGDAEVKDVDKDGKATYQLTISSTDVRDAQKQVPAQLLEKSRSVLATLTGLTIGGTIGANGTSSDVTLHVDKPAVETRSALDMIRLTLPRWPMLPTEPVGIGAKWQVVTSLKVLDKVDVTQTTDYELVKHEASTWTIKGTTKVSGVDQELEGAKLSKIGGTGAVDVALVDGLLYATIKSEIATGFSASMTGPDATGAQQTVTLVVDLKQGAQITPKP